MIKNSLKILLFLFVFCSAMILPIFSALSEEEAESIEGFTYDDHGKRDPFWQLVSSNGTIIIFDKDLTIADLSLGGIIANNNGLNAAIINGNVLKKDDKIGDFIISDITDKKVVLTIGDQTYTLTLTEE